MTKHEANAALCRELGVEPTYTWVVGDIDASCYTNDHEAACIKWRDEHRNYCEDRGYDVVRRNRYPDLSSADVLMAALRKAGHQFSILDCIAEVRRCPARRGGVAYRVIRDYSSEGDALFFAACSVFDIEVSE